MQRNRSVHKIDEVDNQKSLTKQYSNICKDRSLKKLSPSAFSPTPKYSFSYIQQQGTLDRKSLNNQHV